VEKCSVAGNISGIHAAAGLDQELDTLGGSWCSGFEDFFYDGTGFKEEFGKLRWVCGWEEMKCWV